MSSFPLQRDPILQAIRAAVEPLPFVHAMWEGGAAAFDRVDQWSDIDLQLDVDDDHVMETVQAVEGVLALLSPVELRYEIPQPTWHGHWQVFYRLRDAGPYLLIDLAILKHSSNMKFLEPEIHGQVRVHFDKSGVVQSTPPLDQAALAEKRRERLEILRLMFPMFQSLTLKELHRGNTIEAVTFYQNYTLRPLIEVLRIRYAPNRYNFFARYVHYDLPAPVVQQLERLCFVADQEDLYRKRQEAEILFFDTLQAVTA